MENRGRGPCILLSLLMLGGVVAIGVTIGVVLLTLRNKEGTPESAEDQNCEALGQKLNLVTSVCSFSEALLCSADNFDNISGLWCNLPAGSGTVFKGLNVGSREYVAGVVYLASRNMMWSCYDDPSSVRNSGIEDACCSLYNTSLFCSYRSATVPSYTLPNIGTHVTKMCLCNGVDGCDNNMPWCSVIYGGEAVLRKEDGKSCQMNDSLRFNTEVMGSPCL